MEENNNNVGNGNSPAENKTNENKEERLFTQEEVNKIIKQRLERGKTTDEELTEKESKLTERETQLTELQNQLSQRESRIDCKEYLQLKGYPAELIDVLDTSDVDAFKDKADATMKIANTRSAAPIGSSEPVISGKLPDAFSINYKHVPKDLAGE